MKKSLFLIFSLFAFSSCAANYTTTHTVKHTAGHTSNHAVNRVKSRINARVTYYSNSTCPFGAKVADPNTRVAKEGITIAASKKLFKFGTKVIIHGMKGVLGISSPLVVQDRGTAVNSAKASHGKTPVFDVYVHANSHQEGVKREQYLASINPDYLVVDILYPEDVSPGFKNISLED